MSADGSVSLVSLQVTGHWKRGLWGLAPHPVRNEFATVGDDKLVRLWSMDTRRQINSLPLGEVREEERSNTNAAVERDDS
jgi:WD40 repeat protein